jgi:hypothetical protein
VAGKTIDVFLHVGRLHKIGDRFTTDFMNPWPSNQVIKKHLAWKIPWNIMPVAHNDIGNLQLFVQKSRNGSPGQSKMGKNNIGFIFKAIRKGKTTGKLNPAQHFKNI